MHLRPIVILRVGARSATAQENTSHAVTRPRTVVELVVAFTDPGSFWCYGAAASLLLDAGICSVIEHQQDHLMYRQTVIEFPNMPRDTEEDQLTSGLETRRTRLRSMISSARNSQMWKRIRWETCPCLEWAMLERNEWSSLRSCWWCTRKIEQSRWSRDWAIQWMDSRSGDDFWEEWEPVNRGRYRAMLMQLLQCPLTGSKGRALEEWECPVRQYEAQNLDTLRDTFEAAILAHNPKDSECCRLVGLSVTRPQEYDTLKKCVERKAKARRKGKGKGKCKGKEKASAKAKRERKKQG